MFLLAALTAVAMPLPAEAASPRPAASTRDPAGRHYCVVGTVTGSRLQRKECHTLEEWRDLGVDTRDWTRR